MQTTSRSLLFLDHMKMPGQISKKKLWLLLTTLWCIGVVTFFFQQLARDYRNSIQSTQMTLEFQIESKWRECAPNAWLKFGHECQIAAEDQCKRSDLIFHERCIELEQDDCVRSKFPGCSYIFSNAQKDFLATPKWKAKLDRVTNFLNYSRKFWKFLALLLAGPLCFLLLPPILRGLREWLYVQ